MVETVIGKYKVINYNNRINPSLLVTDNPIEAVWNANKSPNREIINICGEREFIREKGRWKLIPLP